MRMKMVLVLCAALALTVGVATATGGNDGPKKCGNGRWQTVVRTDGTSFKNEDKCIDYLRSGGTVHPAAPIQVGIFYVSPPSSFRFEAGNVTGTGFLANTRITFTVIGPAQNGLNDPPYVFSDANGAFNSGTSPSSTSTYLYILCSNAGATLHVTATDGLHIGVTDFTIPTC